MSLMLYNKICHMLLSFVTQYAFSYGDNVQLLILHASARFKYVEALGRIIII